VAGFSFAEVGRSACFQILAFFRAAPYPLGEKGAGQLFFAWQRVRIDTVRDLSSLSKWCGWIAQRPSTNFIGRFAMS